MNRLTPFFAALVCLATALLHPGQALAQEVLYTPSGTSPGEGIAATRHYFNFESYDNAQATGQFDFNQLTVETAFSYGITSDLTFMIHVPVTYRDFNEPAGQDSENFGIEDLNTMFKYRFYQDDLDSIDTLRMSALGGIQLPSYDDGFSTDSFDPFLGWAMTAIKGRHGFGAHAMYKWNTGDDETGLKFDDTEADSVRLDASYLYRIDPDAYTIDTTKSTYFVVEVNHRYEVNGDDETLLSPGILIEAQRWAGELSVRLPIAQSVSHRAELDWAVTLGLRFTY